MTVGVALIACLAPQAASALSPSRGWELVSPVEKNGGEVRAAGSVFGGGVFQAAANGESVTYSSKQSFGSTPQSAPPGSQYIATRGAAGWASANLDVPIFSGSYGPQPDGVPYQLFSTDLSRGVLLNGLPCRAEVSACPVANPPLAGTDAPAGYQDYYALAAGGFSASIGDTDIINTSLDPAHFSVSLAGASPDLTQLIFSSCAALSPDATEVPVGEGCDPAMQNLYRYSAGGLTLVNATPGATLAAPAGAVSGDGSRVYYVDSAGDLYLRDGGTQVKVMEAAAEKPIFQAASSDGQIAYYSYAGILFRYDAETESSTPLTDAFTLTGVLGASEDGSYVYYQTTEGLFVDHDEAVSKISAAPDAAEPSDYPPASGTARVSADGTTLAFLSKSPLTGYDNDDQKTGLADSEVFVYDTSTKGLRCASCRSNGTRPIGPSWIPGADSNGTGPAAFAAYKSRALSADGGRVFFGSEDSLVGPDVNKEPDVYEWVPFGNGCTKAGGCAELISSGRSEEGAEFVDASSSGSDVFFTTDGSLVGSDPGAFDLYDARIGGGFPEPSPPIPCVGDACQELPSEPVDPALNTVVSGPGNPKVRYFKYKRHGVGCRGAASKKKAKCHKKSGKGKKHGPGKGGRR